MYILKTYICGLLILLDLVQRSLSVQLVAGDCPIYFDEPCNPDMVKFILSVKIENNTYRYPLNPYKPLLPRGFNVLLPLKIVIHGYGGLNVDYATPNVTAAYEQVGYNVIIVDWGLLAAVPCYTTAYLNTFHVGQCVSILTASLLVRGISPGFMHVVGFSLGAHVAGFAGLNLKNAVGYQFRRITGLDPALPFFATLKNDWKLDPSDAYFVDVIHTSAGTFGKLEATGHVDFYINGGVLQPYCYKAKHPPICSHMTAGLYFSESIRARRKGFVGIECDNAALYWLNFCTSGKKEMMGENTKSTIRGIYYVRTSDRPPFALNDI